MMMPMAIRFMWTLAAIILVLCALATPSKGRFTPATHLNSTVRAANCINNETHCHCADKPASTTCTYLKPTSSDSMLCTRQQCGGNGYHCDCEAHDICLKLSVVSYYATDEASTSTSTIPCAHEQSTVPRNVVGQTSDLDIQVRGEFQLFVNGDEIGFAQSSVHKTFTAEISSGDRIALIVKQEAPGVYGIKMRFRDLQGTTRVIDDSWLASPSYVSSWLHESFDPVDAGWMPPVELTGIDDAAFDADVPWMWQASAETVFFRYVVS